MVAKDLMIGDRVQDINCTTPSRVAGVTPGKVHTWWADNTKHAKDEVYYKPIPITAEILEKNGFKHTKVNVNGTMYSDDLFEVKGGDGVTLFLIQNKIWNGIVLSYVHELQHALRMAGLNRLADDFKI